MANLYNTPNSPQEPDEISLFLQQILLRSSSAFSDHLPAPDPAQIYLPNVSSSNVGNSENEFDDCDYESEETAEALVEETVARPTLSSRSSSKRSRAAEVHNLSEKRRRSRINEKMKALQNLIPNSNKTDKASMLDEAIEYLKQLQLQVQMLTMRNGLSLYPICLPGVVQPTQMNTNMTKAVCMDQNISAPVADLSHTIASISSLEAQSSMHQLNFGSSKGLCKENSLLRRPLIRDRAQCSSGAFATTSIPCETHASNLKGNSVEAYQGGGEHLLPNFVNSPIFSSQLNM